MTIFLLACVVLLLCPDCLSASPTAKLKEIDDVLIYEADMKDVGKSFYSCIYLSYFVCGCES